MKDHRRQGGNRQNLISTAREGCRRKRVVWQWQYTPKHPEPTASKKIDTHQTCKSKDPDVNDKNIEQQTLRQIEPQKGRSGKPVYPSNNVKSDNIHPSKHSVELIVGHTQKLGKTNYIVRWYKFTSRAKMKEPPDLGDSWKRSLCEPPIRKPDRSSVLNYRKLFFKRAVCNRPIRKLCDPSSCIITETLITNSV